MTLLEQLQQMAPMAAAATEAPWHVEFDYEGDLDVPMIMSVYGPISTIEEIHDNYVDEEHARATGAFIAAARNLLTPENLTLLVAALTHTPALPAPYSGICAEAAAGGLTEEQAYDWRSNGMNGQYDDTFDAGVIHGHAELAATLLAVSATTTTKGFNHND